MSSIPVLHVTERTLAEAYEKALVSLYEKGARFKTQYDKPGDPLSLDCTINITILEPEMDPMIHQAFPGGIDELKDMIPNGPFPHHVPFGITVGKRCAAQSNTDVVPTADVDTWVDIQYGV